MIKNIAAYTLGCKANQYDTSRLLSIIKEKGYTLSDFNDKADIYIINTCTVTHTGDQKSLQLIRRAKKKNPEAWITVCGCLAAMDADTVNKVNVDFIFDARKPEDFIAWLGKLDCKTMKQLPEQFPITSQNRTRAFIKIQDGCDRFCTYCIVPYARGPVKSRLIREILNEARTLIESGVREIVLTGIQAAAYGNDVENPVTFSELITQIAALPGLSRLRLGSIEPYAIQDDFIRAIQAPTVCNHFHVSLQSGCDHTLKRMNRRYTAAEYAQAVEKLKAVKPDTALTTDIMVGFPGETQADFNESLAFVTAIGFARIHVFEYSPRKGTPAAGFPDQIPAQVKKERGKIMRRIAEDMQLQFFSAYKGKTMDVLFECKRNGYWEGHTTNYIVVRSKKGAANEIAKVCLTHVNKGFMMGELEHERFVFGNAKG